MKWVFFIVLVLLVVLVGGLIVAIAAAVRWRRAAESASATLASATAAADRVLEDPPASGAQAIEMLSAQRDAARVRTAMLEAAFASSGESIVIFDESLEILFATEAASRIVSARGSEAAAAARVRRAVQAVQQSGEPVVERVDVFGQRRRTLTVEAFGVPTPPGRCIAVLINDVTAQERVTAMGTDFVANVSHELKTPVGALSVLSQAITEAPDEETRRRLASRLDVEAQRMAALIDDILDLSLVEQERSALVPTDVLAVVDEACRRVAIPAEEAGIEIRRDYPGGAVTVLGDTRQLVSAVSNLLDNALKYSSILGDVDPQVWVRIVPGQDQVVIEIEDKGVGIPERHRERIFERFYRVDRARSRERGGTGLGLAIVRLVALNHGGAVEVESTAGVGSTFRLRLPQNL